MHPGTVERGPIPLVAAVEREPGRSVWQRDRRSDYELLDRLTSGRHTFGSALTQQQTANRPDKAFTATLAARSGEQIQIDSTSIDVLVLAADGVPARADLTTAVDVAARAGPCRQASLRAMRCN
jgi:hypothetical protein